MTDNEQDRQMTDVEIEEGEIKDEEIKDREVKDREKVNDNEMEQSESGNSKGNIASLPLARVKRIMKQDDEIVSVSSGAVIAVAAATDIFIQYFTEQALLVARGEKHKKLSYNDFANAVARVEQLEFLSELVPKTIPYKKVIERKQAGKDNAVLLGQTTLKADNGKLTAVPPVATAENEEIGVSSENETQTNQPLKSQENRLSGSQSIEVGEYQVLPQHLNPGPESVNAQQQMMPNMPEGMLGGSQPHLTQQTTTAAAAAPIVVPPQGYPPVGIPHDISSQTYTSLGQQFAVHENGSGSTGQPSRHVQTQPSVYPH